MGVMDTINYYYYDSADPRVRDWLIMRSVWTPVIITLVYLFISFKIITDHMKNRPAYKLNTFIKCYNLFQVVTNAYVVREFSSCYPFSRIFECRPIEYDTSECGMKIVTNAYFLLWIKIIDLSETAIYLLRKKNNQVSVLHLYHHISTCLVGFIFGRYFTSEVSLLFPILNSGVHVIMYFYYFLSNFDGPIKQMINPFKRYLTLLQMGQFVIMIVQVIVYKLQDCGLSQGLLTTMLINVSINFGLFYNFYRKAYMSPKKKKIN